MAPSLFNTWVTVEQKKLETRVDWHCLRDGQALILVQQRCRMKVLAPKNQTFSLEFPLTKRRTWRFALVNPRTLVPSTLDFMRVNNATVREGRAHRVWPPDVLRKFQTAEIITELQTQHYVLRDRSISPVTR